jgi:hypothetical protein
MDDFLTKPLLQAPLADMVERWRKQPVADVAASA